MFRLAYRQAEGLIGSIIVLLGLAAEGARRVDPAAVHRYLKRAFGVHLQEVREAMEELAGRYESQELNRIGFRLYEQFRPDVPSDNEGWGAKAARMVL